MTHKNFNVIILAAGQGKRMLSDIPKVMHKIAGKTMLQHLIDSVSKINIGSIYVVHNFETELINNIMGVNKQKIPIYWILQDIPRGTGHAVQQALSIMHDDTDVLILYGDVPFVSYKTLNKLLFIKNQCDICLLTCNIKNPQGYGRIIRNNIGEVISIMEDADIIDDNIRKITEIHSGILVSMTGFLKKWLDKLNCNNTKNELYLTDIVKIAYNTNHSIHTIHPINFIEVMGINNKLDLIHLERKYQKKQAQNLLGLGVTIFDPDRFDLRGTLVFGKDVIIDINVVLEGNVFLGNRVNIGASCILKDVEIEDDVVIYPFSCIENSKIGCKSIIGPFARLRPGNKLYEEAVIGNFVELKNVKLGKHTKVGHLSYVGDAEIGDHVNVGAGTIFCNYDGCTKNYTYVADNVFIGSDSQLVAPVKIGKNAIIGAGTTVTKNVETGDIIISRVSQFSILSKKNFKK